MTWVRVVRFILGAIFIGALVFARYTYSLPDDYLAEPKTRHDLYLEDGITAYQNAMKTEGEIEKNSLLNASATNLRRAIYFKPDDFEASLFLGKVFLESNAPDSEKIAKHYLHEALSNAKESRELSKIKATFSSIDTKRYSTITESYINKRSKKTENLDKVLRGKLRENCIYWKCAQKFGIEAFRERRYSDAETWFSKTIDFADKNGKETTDNDGNPGEPIITNLTSEIAISSRRFASRSKLAITYFHQRSKLKKANAEFQTLLKEYKVLNKKYKEGRKREKKPEKELFPNLIPKIKFYANATYIATSPNPESVTVKAKSLFGKIFGNRRLAVNSTKLDEEFVKADKHLQEELKFINTYDEYITAGYIYRVNGDKLKSFLKKKKAREYYSRSIGFYDKAEVSATRKIENLGKRLEVLEKARRLDRKKKQEKLNMQKEKEQWKKNLAEVEKSKKGVINAKLPIA